jgi:hypothetical protein
MGIVQEHGGRIMVESPEGSDCRLGQAPDDSRGPVPDGMDDSSGEHVQGVAAGIVRLLPGAKVIVKAVPARLSTSIWPPS